MLKMKPIRISKGILKDLGLINMSIFNTQFGLDKSVEPQTYSESTSSTVITVVKTTKFFSGQIGCSDHTHNLPFVRLWLQQASRPAYSCVSIRAFEMLCCCS